MEYPGNLFVVAAPSGAGKSSLVKALLELDSHLVVSVSHTTRPPRGQEQEGREYWFISEPEFRAKIDHGDFFEWAEVHGNLYGTSREGINLEFERGLDVLLEIFVPFVSLYRHLPPMLAAVQMSTSAPFSRKCARTCEGVVGQSCGTSRQPRKL